MNGGNGTLTFFYTFASGWVSFFSFASSSRRLAPLSLPKGFGISPRANQRRRSCDERDTQRHDERARLRKRDAFCGLSDDENGKVLVVTKTTAAAAVFGCLSLFHTGGGRIDWMKRNNKDRGKTKPNCSGITMTKFTTTTTKTEQQQTPPSSESGSNWTYGSDFQFFSFGSFWRSLPALTVTSFSSGAK